MTYSLLVFVGNPTQYHAPLFRRIAASSEIEIKVMFGDEIGIKPFFNPEVLSVIEWDVPILEGYKHCFFKNLSSSDRKGFWSRNNPSMIPYIYRSNAEYVLIHGYDTLSSWYVYLAALFSRKKIIWRGETIERKSGRKLARLIKSIVLPLYFHNIFLVLYSCTANRECIKKYLPDQTEKMVSFPCAVDNAFFQTLRLQTPQERLAVREEYGLPEDHLVIVSCCRLTKRKRIDLILDAMTKMRSNKVSLLLIGNGPERDGLMKMAKDYGVNIIVTGFVGQRIVAKLLSVADIFALMSSYDASPKALNEAMNFPLPMLVSDGVGTSRDLVKEGVNGFIIHDGEEQLLVEYLNRLAEDSVMRLSMGQKNESIIKEYSLDNDVHFLLEAINKIEKN